jgi:hypothetical protein
VGIGDGRIVGFGVGIRVVNGLTIIVGCVEGLGVGLGAGFRVGFGVGSTLITLPNITNTNNIKLRQYIYLYVGKMPLVCADFVCESS